MSLKKALADFTESQLQAVLDSPKATLWCTYDAPIAVENDIEDMKIAMPVLSNLPSLIARKLREDPDWRHYEPEVIGGGIDIALLVLHALSQLESNS
jgi:hypothetical protein